MYATPTMNTTTTISAIAKRSNRRKGALGAVEFFCDGDVSGVEIAAWFGEVRVRHGRLLGGVACLAYASTTPDSPGLLAGEMLQGNLTA